MKPVSKSICETPWAEAWHSMRFPQDDHTGSTKRVRVGTQGAWERVVLVRIPLQAAISRAVTVVLSP
jgi:hypothetical protein